MRIVSPFETGYPSIEVIVPLPVMIAPVTPVPVTKLAVEKYVVQSVGVVFTVNAPFEDMPYIID
jgi:hypothetical protein